MNNATVLSIIAIGLSSLTLLWNILWSIHREFATPKFMVVEQSMKLMDNIFLRMRMQL